MDLTHSLLTLYGCFRLMKYVVVIDTGRTNYEDVIIYAWVFLLPLQSIHVE